MQFPEPSGSTQEWGSEGSLAGMDAGAFWCTLMRWQEMGASRGGQAGAERGLSFNRRKGLAQRQRLLNM